ncbi:MAG: hypothetical protein ABGX04_02410 [Myxococcales bacterium]|nr:hypothetical protein [Myxococcales bacterium]HIK84087.1 hypothetical protein [Myxococcales bacterium]
MSRNAVVAAIALSLAIGFLTGSYSSKVVQRSNLEPVEDLAKAIDQVLLEGSRLDRMSRLGPLLEQLDAENLSSVEAIYMRDLPNLGECDIRPFVDAWTRFDAPGAFSSALQWKYVAKRRIGVEAAVHGWAIRMLPGALLAVEQTAEERPRLAQMLRESLVSGWVHSGADGLSQYLRETPGELDPLLTIAVGATLRRHGVEELLRWSDEFGHGSTTAFQAKVFAKTVHTVGRRDPERAATWILDHMGKDYVADSPRILAEVWIDVDPIRAFEWLRTESPEEGRGKAVGLTFGRWLFMDREAALSWLGEKPRTPFHDPAINTMARQLSRTKPEESIEWCGEIMTSEWSQRCHFATAKIWYRRDPKVAEQWLAASPLSEDDRESVRESAMKRSQKKAKVSGKGRVQ